MHRGNPSPSDVEAGQKGIQGHLWLHSKFQVILGYMTPIFKTNKQTKQKPSLDYLQCPTWYKCCVKFAVQYHLRCNLLEKSIHRQYRGDLFRRFWIVAHLSPRRYGGPLCFIQITQPKPRKSTITVILAAKHTPRLYKYCSA